MRRELFDYTIAAKPYGLNKAVMAHCLGSIKITLCKRVTMQIKIKDQYKSIKKCEFELPSFSVLTGKNGSGKSHLLEVLANNSLSEVYHDGKIVKNILHKKFSELIPEIQESCDWSLIPGHIKNMWNEFNKIKNSEKIIGKNITNESFLAMIGDKNLKLFVSKVIDDTKEDFINLTEDDFSDYFDMFFMGKGGLFHTRLAIIFKNYHRMWIENDQEKYYKEKGMRNRRFILSDEEFIEKHGQPPWELVNNIFNELGISYEANNPVGTRLDSSFILKFRDKKENIDIQSKDFSTGEKVLLSLAVAIYNNSDNFEKPELLLIDEPDAALHPSMSKKMINVLYKNIYEENRIPVIITTHSPTTVIASEGITIYQLLRGDSIPRKTSTQEAIEILSGEIPFLKISNEKRRQVFVESKYDVRYYELISNILARTEPLPSEPIFIAVRTSNGSNCTDVINIVKNLSGNGNDQVYGIIDWDLTNTESGKIIVLGGNKRYSIENYLLDPLLMGLFFIRERDKDINYFGEISFRTYSEASKMTEDDAQKIIDKIISDLNLLTSNIVEYQLSNNYTLKISKEFLEHQGHKLESLYKVKFTFLKRHQKEDELKIDIINKVINDYPQFTPSELFDTIKKIK